LNYLKFFFLSIFCLSLFACGGGGSNDTLNADEKFTIEEVDPEGFWLGYQTIIGVDVYNMRTIIYDGKLLGISEDAGVMFSGTYGMEEKRVLVSDGQEGSDQKYMLYDMYDEGRAFARGIVAVTVEEKNKFSGTFSNETLQEGEIYSNYSALFERGASLDYIDGDYNYAEITMSISPEGAMSGTWRGCALEGTIAVPEADKNVYTINYTLDACAYSGEYSGLGFVNMIDEDAYLVILADGGDRMDGFGFQLSDVPAVFDLSISEVRAGKAAEQSVSQALYTYLSTRGYYDNPTVKIDENGSDKSGSSYSWKDIDMNAYDTDFSNSTFSYGKIFLSSTLSHPYRIDNSDFSHSTFDSMTIETNASFTPRTDYITNKFEELNLDYGGVFAIAHSDFRYITFNSSFEIYAYDTDFSHSDMSGSTIFGYCDHCNFTQANLQDVTIEFYSEERSDGTYRSTESKFWFSDLVGTDFRNADLTGMTATFSDFSYANFTGATGIDGFLGWNRIGSSSFSNAWWTDGSRCSAASVSKCLPKVYDNGLTYEEYLDGKTDLDKDAEKLREIYDDVSDTANDIISKGGDIVNEGVKVVKSLKFW
jgi:uncharacterized protein YjbI with pentapeptide repeats